MPVNFKEIASGGLMGGGGLAAHLVKLVLICDFLTVRRSASRSGTGLSRVEVRYGMPQLRQSVRDRQSKANQCKHLRKALAAIGRPLIMHAFKWFQISNSYDAILPIRADAPKWSRRVCMSYTASRLGTAPATMPATRRS